jgi:hypothetical protein
VISVEVNKVAVLEVANGTTGSSSTSLWALQDLLIAAVATPPNIDPLCYYRLDGALCCVAISSRPLNHCVN